MNRFTKSAALIITCAALIAVSGCSQTNSGASSTTTTAAPEITTTAAPATETTTAAAKEETTTVTTTEAQTETSETEVTEELTVTDTAKEGYDSDPVKHPFKLGVWLVQEGDPQGLYYDEYYYNFTEGGGGSFIDQQIGIGLGFSYEMNEDGNGLTGKFMMGAVDNFVDFEIADVGISDNMKVKYGQDGDLQTWTYLCPTDEFSYYTNQELGEMAKFLYGQSQYCPENIDFDASIENGLISILIFDPTESDGTKSQQIWYYIDRYTGKGTDSNGNEVDLTMFADHWEDMPYAERFAPSPDLEQRHDLVSDGSMFGFWYMGYVNPAVSNTYDDRELLCNIYRSTGVMEQLRLLKSFPSDRFVNTGDGQELYFILPADEHGTISVTKLELDEETATLKEKEVLYSSDNYSYPILLKCNVSEIYPDVLIKITDSSGRSVEWSPFVSGRDGTVSTDNESGVPIRDFTDYSKLSGGVG